MKVVAQCPKCGKTHLVEIEFDNSFDCEQLTQIAMAFLNPDEGGELIAELCPECQNTSQILVKNLIKNLKAIITKIKCLHHRI